MKAEKNILNSGRLDRNASRFTIAGFFISLLFAVWGIRLTIRYGENDDQIKKLSAIAKNQESENAKLSGMMKSLQDQNILTQNSLAALTKILSENKTQNLISSQLYATSKIQSKTSKQQYAISSRLEETYKLDDSIQQTANIMTLVQTFDKLFNYCSYESQAMVLNKAPIEQRHAIVTHLRTLLETELTNKVFLTNSYVKLAWWFFYWETTEFERNINSYEHRGTLIKNVDDFNEQSRIYSGKVMDFNNKLLPFRAEFQINFMLGFAKDAKYPPKRPIPYYKII